MSYPSEDFTQFATVRTIDGGADVIDVLTGHPVDHREAPTSAAGKAYRLNLAASRGGLEAALGARQIA